MGNQATPTVLVMEQSTPTLFVDYDGTLHRGHALLAENGEVTLDSGQPMFEYASLLADMLEPYPGVEIVLTTSWLNTFSFEKVVSFLPSALARRVVATTQHIKPRFGYLKDGSARTYVIRSYVFEKRLKNWLAIDDSLYGAYHLSTDFLDLTPHLLLVDPQSGISDAEVQRRINEWLVEVHTQHSP